MEAFKENPGCSKCNHYENPEIKYVPNQRLLFRGEFRCDCGVTTFELAEHLHVTCRRCGYLWSMGIFEPTEK